jgi:hypothetical protein
MDLINARKMDYIPSYLQLLKAHMLTEVMMCFIRKCNFKIIPWWDQRFWKSGREMEKAKC